MEQAIKELHYRPNNVARALKGKRSNQLLFIADQITNEYFSRIVSEMDKYAYDAGFLISLCANRNTPEFVSQVISRQYDGIIISSTSIPMEYVTHFSNAGIPVLLFEHRKHENLPERVATLASGLYTGARTGVNHLIGRGRKHIIYIDRISLRGNVSGPTDLRLNGYLDEMKSHGLDAGSHTIIAGCHTEEELAETVIRYIGEHQAVDGMIGRNDMVACIAMQAACRQAGGFRKRSGWSGLTIPVSAGFVPRGMTTLEMQREEISRTVIEMMLQMMSGKIPEHAAFETKLIVREST